MITELANALYEVVTSLNVAIHHNTSADLNKNTVNLKLYLEQYKNTPQILYKELFEPWCKVDVIRLYQLTNALISKPEQWSEKSILIAPDIITIAIDLCEIADEIEIRTPEIIAEADHLNPDTSTPTDSPEVVSLPDELNTPEALKIFEQAREIGLISQDFQWLKGLQLLACFAREMSLKLGLGKGLNGDGSPRVSWKPFEQLFKQPQGKLRANYNDILKTGQEPSDIELIDKIFK